MLGDLVSSQSLFFRKYLSNSIRLHVDLNSLFQIWRQNIQLFKIILLNLTKTTSVDFLKFIRISCYLKAELPNLTFSKIKMLIYSKQPIVSLSTIEAEFVALLVRPSGWIRTWRTWSHARWLHHHLLWQHSNYKDL